jgi:hypothetical protein
MMIIATTIDVREEIRCNNCGRFETTEPVQIIRCVSPHILIAAMLSRLTKKSLRSIVDLRFPLGAEIEIQSLETKLAPPSA